MKTNLLLPHSFRMVGWIMLALMVVPGLMIVFGNFELSFLDMDVFTVYDSGFPGINTYFSMTDNNLTNEVVGILFLLGAVFVAFSKEKMEDEFIAKIRLDSLLWAVYLNYAILLFCFLFFYGFGFMAVMILNMYSVLLFFIIRYHIVLIRYKRIESHEEQA